MSIIPARGTLKSSAAWPIIIGKIIGITRIKNVIKPIGTMLKRYTISTRPNSIFRICSLKHYNFNSAQQLSYRPLLFNSFIYLYHILLTVFFNHRRVQSQHLAQHLFGMLAQQRWWSLATRWSRGKFWRWPNHVHPLTVPKRDLLNQPSRLNLRIIQRRRNVVDRPRRNARCQERINPGANRSFRENR